MMKKILPVICCLLPVSAGLAAECVESDGIIICNSANTIGSNGDITGWDIGDGQKTHYIQSGKGLTLGTGGLVVNNMYVGRDWTSGNDLTGALFIGSGAGTGSTFEIQSAGAVSVNSLLQVLSGRNFVINSTSGPIDVTLMGGANAVGGLTLNNVGKLTSGTITAANGLTINAQSIDMTTGAVGGIDVAGATNITATGAIATQQIISQSGNAVISGAAIESGSIQNQADNMTITSTGALITKNNSNPSNPNNIGSIENMGGIMTVNAGATHVAGTVSNTGTMNMTVASLTVDGGTGNNASFVNKGDLKLTVTGDDGINLANGFDLSAMKTTNTFALTTTKLTLGGGANSWLQVFSNNLNSFALTVTDGAINASSGIVNGIARSGTETLNAAATMNIVGQSVNATSVANHATQYVAPVAGVSNGTGYLKITATSTNTTDATQGLIISGPVGTDKNAHTELLSAGNLTVGGDISNYGALTVNGVNVSLRGVTNDGGTLTLLGATDESGKITVSQGVTNKSGNTTINARQIDIDGVVKAAGGTLTVAGSDFAGASMTLGGVNAAGGSIFVNALQGGIDIDGDMIATNGALNVGANTYRVTVGGAVQIDNDLTFNGVNATAGGDMNVLGSGDQTFVLTAQNSGDETSAIHVGGDVTATDGSVARSGQFIASTMDVGGNVTVANKGNLTFGEKAASLMNSLDVGGGVDVTSGGIVNLFVDDVDVGTLSENGGLVTMHGTQLTAGDGDIDIRDGVWFGGVSPTPTRGLVVADTDTVTLRTTAADGDVTINGGASIASGNTLNLTSDSGDVTLNGVVSANGKVYARASQGTMTLNQSLTNKGRFDVTAKNISVNSVTNNDTLVLDATNSVTMGTLTTSGTATVSGTELTMAGLTVSDGTADLTAGTLTINSVAYLSGGKTNMTSWNAQVNGAVTVYGDMGQGAAGAKTLNIIGQKNVNRFEFDSLNVHSSTTGGVTTGGEFVADAQTVSYSVTRTATFDGAFTVNSPATVDFVARDISIGGALTNNGALSLTSYSNNAADGIGINGDIINIGNLDLDSGAGVTSAHNFTVNNGITNLAGAGLTLTGAFGADDASNMLYQTKATAPVNGDFNITSADYEITAASARLAGIVQTADANNLVLNTSDLTVDGNIDVKSNLMVAANPYNDWMTVTVAGDILGNTQFVGLKSMTVGGNYIFDNNSQIFAAILPYDDPSASQTAMTNYWATVSLNDDNTLGKITNAEDDAAPLISVGGYFESRVDEFDVSIDGGALQKPQVGIRLYDVVDQGTAIWLLHADNGTVDSDITTKIRNLNVSFCNEDSSLCMNYLDFMNSNNGADADLPVYISVRDSDGDGKSDSLYLVFDPRFGGPVEIFKIQPIVGRVDDHTGAEFVAAGALDNLIDGQVKNAGFRNRTPIELIPIVFKNTNLQTFANELYDRMEYYNLNRDGTGVARFSRLFQVRELEQIAAAVALNEHTSFRSFEDRMFDEFIWNRHRNLKKAWADIDYGMLYHRASDDKHVDGTRFSISGGFDWQESKTLVLGLTGRVSRTSSQNSDDMNLGYLPTEPEIAGHIDIDVTDTDIGLGGYMMKILGDKTRLYGNAFLDVHILDVDRSQNFVDHIDGRGTAVSVISEWGLLHDWLNQYIVGNMYARVGYNFGFTVNESAGGADYMDLKSDGYFILTPGYSLTAQKRIYPSSWIQLRPYATIGIEYDVLGAPENVKYKFAMAHQYTSYNVDINPMWANIGGGIELLSAMGAQVGIDYRYQYNSDIQLHNIRLSGSYRF